MNPVALVAVKERENVLMVRAGLLIPVSVPVKTMTLKIVIPLTAVSFSIENMLNLFESF